MTHQHEWQLCKKSGKLRHKCKPEDWEKAWVEHRKETFATYEYCDVCGFEPPSPPNVKLDPAITFGKLKKRVSPYFLKAGHRNIGEITDEQWEALAVKATKGNHGNYIRLLCEPGYWEKDTKPLLESVFKEQMSGKIRNKISEKFKDLFRRRVGTYFEKDWVVELDFHDNSMLSVGTGGDWDIHPANPDWNRGFYVPELGQPYHTHPSHLSWIGQWYHWDSVDKKWSQEPYFYRSEEDMSARDREDMNGNRATRELWYFFMHEMLKLAKEEWGDKFHVGTNEVSFRSTIHLNVLANLFSEYGIPKERRVTSLLYGDWYYPGQAGTQIFTYPNGFLGGLHGCYYYDRHYISRTEYEPIADLLSRVTDEVPLWMFSGDGAPWGRYGKDYKKLEDTILWGMKNGLGWEVNNDFVKVFTDIDTKVGEACNRAIKRYL